MGEQSPVDDSTRTSAAPPPPTPASLDEGRFPAGSLVGGRYRILALLGRGGMGEVYRAHDLILNQVVALKFLPPKTEANQAVLARFRNEVRIARQVTHPNVCRVYDIGVADGLHYLSMEYLDGEDLASLLRRIGRLPQEKALDIARRLCAGLAAAHDRGVLHRDFKPANVMIDARGQVHITDFGLAVLGETISDIGSGTPLYMAPEQLAGKEVTERSDLYALGLVLYEIFTGKRPFEAKSREELSAMRGAAPPKPPSEYVHELDPMIERAIQRCLAPEPRQRPSSAFAVAAALPGGDPVAAALAAGETPSPEMVAASGEREGFRPRVAVAWFLALVVGLIALPFAGEKLNLLGLEPLPFTPEQLEMKAGEILRRLGHAEQPGFRNASGFHSLRDNYTYAKSKGLETGFARHEPALTEFWYREIPAGILNAEFVLNPALVRGRISATSPGGHHPHEALIHLDPAGRLRKLRVHPAPGLPPPGASPQTFDWNRLFAEAGLDPARLTSTPPIHTPPVWADARAAWLGSLDAAGGLPIRVEAAAWRGQPVHFSVELDYGGGGARLSQVPGGSAALLVFFAVPGLLILGAACLKAHSNFRSFSADRAGAWRLFVVVFFLNLGALLAGMNHAASPDEIQLLVMTLSWSAFSGTALCVLYLAIEPVVRRSHPHMLVSWSRLMAGRFRDPLLASHLLAASALGVMRTVTYCLGLSWTGSGLGTHGVLSGNGPLVSVAGRLAVDVSFFSLGWVLLWVFTARLFRREWAGMLAAGLTCIPLNVLISTPWPVPLWFIPSAALFVYGVRAFGLTGAVVMGAVMGVIMKAPVTSRLDAWHSANSLWVYALVVLFAAWQLRIILRGRPLGAESEAH